MSWRDLTWISQSVAAMKAAENTSTRWITTSQYSVCSDRLPVLMKLRSRWMDEMLIRANPSFTLQRRLVDVAATARWARTLATLFAAGIPLVEALPAVAGASGNRVFEQASLRIRQSLLGGSRFSHALESQALFAPLVVQMAEIGEEFDPDIFGEQSPQFLCIASLKPFVGNDIAHPPAGPQHPRPIGEDRGRIHHVLHAIERGDQIDGFIGQRQTRNISLDETQGILPFGMLGQLRMRTAQRLSINIHARDRAGEALGGEQHRQLPRPAAEIEHIAPAQFLVGEMPPARCQRGIAPFAIGRNIGQAQAGQIGGYPKATGKASGHISPYFGRLPSLKSRPFNCPSTKVVSYSVFKG